MPDLEIISYIFEGAEIEPSEQVSEIKVPLEVAENSGITGFAFSSRLLKAVGLSKMEINQAVIDGREPFKYAALAKSIAMDSDGAPVLGENWIKIWIDNAHPKAGSEANYIWMYFGRTKKVKLWGKNRESFPKGATLKWDLNQAQEYLETVPTDAWDEIILVNPSGDGIKIDRIQIVHSGETILDWECQCWLDGSKLEKHGMLGLAAKILETKLAKIGNCWEPQIHWAAREIGKTDYTKYGTGTVWCSEFASWCLRKALWDTPTGDIGSNAMQNYFNGLGRKYTKDKLLDGTYELITGDYLKFSNHSALFIEYLGDPTDENTQMKTIDGNSSQTVGVRTHHQIKSLVSVGCTR